MSSVDPSHNINHGRDIDPTIGLDPVDTSVEIAPAPHSHVPHHSQPEIPHMNIHDIEAAENQLDVEIIDQQLNAVSIVENKMDQVGNIHGNFREVMAVIKWTPDLVNEWFVVPYVNISPFVNIPKGVSKEIGEALQALKIMRTALSGVDVVGNGMALIAQGVNYKHAKLLYQMENEKLKEMESENSEYKDDPEYQNLKKVVIQLKLIIAEEKKTLKTKVFDYVRSTAMTGLGITGIVLRAFESVSAVAKSSIGWTMAILGTISGAIGLWRANEGKQFYKTWMTGVAQDSDSAKQAKELLAKREERMKQLLGQKKEELVLNKIEEQLSVNLKNYLEEQNYDVLNTSKIEEQLAEQSFIEMKDYLAEQNFDISNMKSMSDMKEAIKKNAAIRDVLAKNYFHIDEEAKKAAEHIECIDVMTKNSLKNLSDIKTKNENKIFKFNLIRQKVEFALSCLSSATFITLGILSVAGVIALAGSIMAAPGLGFFLLGLGIAGIGLYYFHKRKPNLFKCYMRCVNLRLMFYNIPSKIRNWQLSKQQLASQKISAQHELWKGLLEQSKQPLEAQPKGLNETIQAIVNNHGGKSLEVLVNEYEDKQKEQDSRVKEAEKKVDYWTGKEGRITKLQNRLKEAGYKDFLKANADSLFVKEGENPVAIPVILAQELVRFKEVSPYLEDTHKIFKEKMGIDLHKLVKEGKLNEETVVDRMKNFFKMDEMQGQYLNFIKKQIGAIEKENAIQLELQQGSA